MISMLLGSVLEIYEHSCVVLCGQVGYEVFIPTPTLLAFHADQKVRLYIHQVFKEDGQTLYGFLGGQERWFFKTLMKVSGVGPKLALAILSHLRCDPLQQAIIHKDVARLTSVPGVGKKVAERLIVELIKPMQGYAGEALSPALHAPSSVMQEAMAALSALGYHPSEAQRVLAQMTITEGVSSATIIKQALKALSSVSLSSS